MDDKPEKEECRCPHCDGPVEPKPPFCQPCGKKFETCKGCGKPVVQGSEYCPQCKPGD